MTRLITALALLALGCDGGAGGTTDPTEVTLGLTTFVVVVNPVIYALFE